jgi:hypothetical protein
MVFGAIPIILGILLNLKMFSTFSGYINHGDFFKFFNGFHLELLEAYFNALFLGAINYPNVYWWIFPFFAVPAILYFTRFKIHFVASVVYLIVLLFYGFDDLRLLFPIFVFLIYPFVYGFNKLIEIVNFNKFFPIIVFFFFIFTIFSFVEVNAGLIKKNEMVNKFYSETKETDLICGQNLNTLLVHFNEKRFLYSAKGCPDPSDVPPGFDRLADVNYYFTGYEINFMKLKVV